MAGNLAKSNEIFEDVVSPLREFIAYETVMATMRGTLPALNRLIMAAGLTPSKFLQTRNEAFFYDFAPGYFDDLGVRSSRFISVALRDDDTYPLALKELDGAPPILYYHGNVSLLGKVSVAVVGTRHPTEAGRALASRVAEMLVRDHFTVVSGLARGIDTAAIKASLDANGALIACIGTSIVNSYPPENADLQSQVAERGLVISHVPIARYEREPYTAKRLHFPERNKIMAAISKATVIVEASNTSGTLTQARACESLKRQLYISSLAVSSTDGGWARGFIERGSIVFEDANDLAVKLECLH